MSELVDQIKAERLRWKSDTSTEASWDATRLTTQVRKSGRADEAIAFAKDALAVWPDFAPLRGGLAWCLRDRYIKPIDEHSSKQDRQAAKQALDSIADLNAGAPYEKYSAWPNAVLAFSSKLCDRWPKASAELLDALDPSRLSNVRSGDFDSLRSRWYATMTKARTKAEQWPEALSTCQAALADGCLDHKGKDWVEHRRCKALLATGAAEEAAEALERLRQSLREWYVDSDLVDVYMKMSDPDRAIAAARRALGHPGPLSMRWRVAMQLGQLLLETEPALADQHLQLARALRKESDWAVNEELESAAAARELPAPDARAAEPGRLRGSWTREPPAEESSGTIKVHLAEGSSGFITQDGGGDDLYFSMPARGGAVAPAVGARVRYQIVDSFDRKKNVKSKRAVKVREIG